MEWFKTKDRTPTEEESRMCLIGIVNGRSGKHKFENKWMILRYMVCADWWYSGDFYDVEFGKDCTVDMWCAVPLPKKEG